MKKTSTLLKGITGLLCALIIYAPSIGQQVDSRSASNLVKQNATAIGLSLTDLQNFRISSAYVDKTSGATMVYAQQTYKGIDVLNAIQTLAFRNGKLIAVSGNRISKMEEIVNTKDGKASYTSANAVKAAALHLKLAMPADLNPVKQINESKEIEYSKMGISSENVKSKLIWVLDENAGMMPGQKPKAYLSWQVALQPIGVADYWLVNVDALSGHVISKINLNIVCDWTNAKHPYEMNAALVKIADLDGNEASLVSSSKYGVVPFPAESPAHPGGTPALRQNPWLLAGAGNDATTLQWHDNGTTTFDSTRGNNVLAQEDRNGNNGFGKGAVSTTALPNLTITAKPNFAKPPTKAANQKFAITNLFYWNNIMHDISYQYGFNEVSGNFQASNLSRGGAGNDYVLADAQDGSGTNNANFSTPSDGSSPRMQMFIFDAVPSFTVNQPASFAGKKTATESGFSTNNKLAAKGPITNYIVLYNDDASGTTHGACTAAANAGALAGRIALIDRGTCDFVTKVKNAQTAGAIAAIVADNIAGEYPFVMGGTDNTITIPAIMVSFETGDSIKQFLAASTPVNVTMTGGVALDGDLDNGVISHEYTHGISNRLTGGPNNVSCLGNKEQMGEGWSDYMGLMVTTNWSAATVNDGPKARPIGTYVLGQANNGPGIRYYPYSTNFSVNPWTYDSMALSSRFSNSFLSYDPHVVGEVWCNMLWEMTWEITKQVGSINTNIYNAAGTGGNSIALQLVIQGMKLQPCSPGFVDGRNAILKADTILYGASHAAAIWRAFARRGLGYNASEVSSNNIKDGIADYSLPPSAPIVNAAVQTMLQTKDAKVSITPNPAKDRIALSINGNTKPLKVYIMDATGKQVVRTNMNGAYLQITLPKITPGVYYVNILGDGINHTQKLIVQ
ncbi:T9SS type A sorting domain-containing protein [Panacibacter ginsenosidivorans]|uniref:T9SS type A sorting domain-containing protein n=1 Tax=Panacibacter ginsenosidivorans TaxID=1813871 RepID=A0A5B8VI21_9BACT|nr:M36 family metallopeptidase [Panacibacter ginsenosidivorans]QEC69938.1 T9SS type A sorting domain-containing protein [Panacibacter ginsenosidivorans]